MHIRFIFHHGKDSLVGKAITFWTGFLALFYNWRLFKYPYSHVEIWFPSRVFKDFEYIPHGKHRAYFAGQCFSSTTRGDANGVRFAPAGEVLKHPERWEYIEAEVDDERCETVVDMLKAEVGKKYDYAGLFGFFWPWNTQKENKWYCSEICAWTACLLRVLDRWHPRISPRRLAKLLAEKYHEPLPLA